MIPKTIHYCWFGHNPKPKLAKKCIKSWGKYCPDFEIKEWNEDNFDISSTPLYVQQAYEAKKWAFVTDYVRLQVVYQYGGVYFDTDVQVLRKIDELLDYKAFFGFESNQYIATGLGFGAEKDCDLLYKMMEDYYNSPFLLENGSYDETPCPQRNSHVFLDAGAKLDGTTQIMGNYTLLSSDYFSPMSWYSKKLNITRNTYTIHWYSASWKDKAVKLQEKKALRKERRLRCKDMIVHFPNRVGKYLLGSEKYELLKNHIKGRT